MVAKEGDFASYRVFGLLILTFVLSVGFASALTTTVNSPSSDTFVISNTWINLTFSDDRLNITNMTVDIYDSSSTKVFTISNTTLLNNSIANVSWPAANGTFTDGNFTINVTTHDNYTGVAWLNYTTVTLIKLDATAPVGNIQFTDKDLTNLTDKKEAGYGTEVRVNCTPTDATSNLNIAQSYMALQFPGLSTYTDNLTLTANTTSQVTATILESQTRELGKYSVLCYVQDNAGNALTTVLNFTTQTVVIGAGSTAGGSGVSAIDGWANPVGTIKIGSGTVSDGGRLTTEGESRLMKPNAVIKFDISGEGHRIEVKAATEDSVVLTISSEPFDVTINAGETEEVDINNDGIADLEVTYHKLFANAWADLTFKQISVPVKAEASDDGAAADTTATAEDTAEYTDSKGGLTVTLAVIVIILIIGYALIKGKKK